MEMLSDKQKKMIIIAGVFVVLIFIYYLSTINREYEYADINETITEGEENFVNKEVLEDKKEIIIHITGAVESEGIVKIKEGDRIKDAIEAAGGLAIDANLKEVNLAYKLKDGQKVYIPRTTDTEEEITINNENGETVIVDQGIQETTTMVNINTATEEQLRTLPGVGEETARKIIEYRQLNGRFVAIQDIKNVTGIGEAKFENIKNYICIE